MYATELCKVRYVFILITLLLTIVFQGRTDAVGKGKIYWSEGNKIRQANLDGSHVKDLLTGLRFPRDITLDISNGKMYWIGHFQTKIMRANLDGSEVETIYTNKGNRLRIHSIECIAVDSNTSKIYWAGAPFLHFYRANLDGTNVQEFETNVRIAIAKDIELDPKARKIYWLNLSPRVVISRTNLNGTNIKHIIHGRTLSDGFALDIQADKIYWSDKFRGRIQNSSLNWDNIEDTVTGLRFPKLIALDKRSRKIYWTENEMAGPHFRIGRANLDGTNVTNVLTGLNNVTGIALHLIGTYDVTSDVNKLTTTWANIKAQ